ncbi:MAG: AbrB/MazE/SpoVT family DNA-binding domain-containing protein [Acidimicrobiia bacterium]|nr:AbrB/MazE/SpoVT family DNA-binding domain-containing protein [Acidimicrobiia bacterium]NNF08917.1 AbrB/MazE/SpoVT family DNA-binding domain-containing protein [Acidimicrobiia bacterium]NNL14066.1 AbrB/MazE/SpoVT family DNA-binding domain-containing protein [Acidimicrobiia bacterium]NNL99010.1 AbrB/MazE/SpoVT family DNA-binding domain-containing protein [Acidimicrobiia bacterium]
MGIRSRINEQGRVVIPAEYRRALGLEPQDSLVLTLESDGVLIRKSSVVLSEVQELVTPYAKGRKLVDELLEERAEETKRK